MRHTTEKKKHYTRLDQLTAADISTCMGFDLEAVLLIRFAWFWMSRLGLAVAFDKGWAVNRLRLAYQIVTMTCSFTYIYWPDWVFFTWVNVPLCDPHMVPFCKYGAKGNASSMDLSRRSTRSSHRFDNISNALIYMTSRWPVNIGVGGFSNLICGKRKRKLFTPVRVLLREKKLSFFFRPNQEMNKRFGWHKENSCGAATSLHVPIWLCARILSPINHLPSEFSEYDE